MIASLILQRYLQFFLSKLINNIEKNEYANTRDFLFALDSISALPLFFETNASRPFPTWKSCNFCLRTLQSKCTFWDFLKLIRMFYGCSFEQRISFSNDKIIMAQFVINGMKLMLNCACYSFGDTISIWKQWMNNEETSWQILLHPFLK